MTRHLVGKIEGNVIEAWLGGLRS